MATKTEESAYKEFFQLIFSDGDKEKNPREPFDYQTRLATGIDFPSLLNAPTGAGKTNAVLGAWLWRRLYKPETVGRRLIYCLPMRTLVEQTCETAKAAIKKLKDNETKIKNILNDLQSPGNANVEDLKFKDNFSVNTLYGGDVSDDWDIYPEREQIIIGTQDLLLSRALNRGYAMNRFRWAFHFGLFNNDCLWVFDEVQLFGDGLATTTQLAAFRENQEKFGTFGKSNSLWMSATLNEKWLETVDFKDKVGDLKRLELDEEDFENGSLKARLNAIKTLQKAPIECRLPKTLAEFAIKNHKRGTQTLIVVNTVQRAQEVFEALESYYSTAEKEANKRGETFEKPERKILHSRFRLAQRKDWQKMFNDDAYKSGAGRIIVATQVIEAGVDISAKLLITDIAPFSSLVQRFGRVNRQGEFNELGGAKIFWVDLPLTKNREKYAVTDLAKLDDKTLTEISKIVNPYEWESIEETRAILEKDNNSASPNDLRQINYEENYTPNHVLRQRDLIDLFDTTADLSGFDLDISRFVRGGEERDISVYWRENVEENIKHVKGTKKEKKELAKQFAPHREELCPVAIYEAKPFIDKVKKAWTFDALNGEWREIKSDNLRTGMIILLDAKNGGYDETGWNPKSKKVIPVELLNEKEKTEAESNTEAVDDDNQTFETKVENKFISYTQTLAAHSREVREKAVNILEKIALPELMEFSEEIFSAAHHHDLGKAHDFFQTTLHKAVYGEENAVKPFTLLLAKSAKQRKHGKERKKFRHELASALAMLKNGRSDLEIYLAASHHGKVRLSIRALPDENFQPERKFARGVWEGDELPEVDLGDGVMFPAQALSLNTLILGKTDGEPSWLERMINLRDKHGVFRLAYLEAIVRAADVQASAYPKDTLSNPNDLNSVEIN